MRYPVEQEDEDIDCSEAEQFALPSSDTRHQSFIMTAQNTRTNEALSNKKKCYPSIFLASFSRIKFTEAVMLIV